MKKYEDLLINDDEILDIYEKFEKRRRAIYELVVIGNTNVGKSSFLNNLTGMKGFFNTSVTRETTCFWKFRVEHDMNMTSAYEMRVSVINSTSKKLMS